MIQTLRHSALRRLRQPAALTACLLACVAAGGCSSMGYLGYLLSPEAPKQTVKAEFDGLAGSRVAILVFSDERVQYEYPYARLTLSSVIRAELTERIKDVMVIDPARVCKYQDEHFNWDSMDKTALAKDLGADYVLFVVLVEYSTREPGSVNLYRGRITAQVGLYEADLPEPAARVWRCDRLAVVYPRENPVGLLGEDDRVIRGTVERMFAEALVKKFYDHKVAKQ